MNWINAIRTVYASKEVPSQRKPIGRAGHTQEENKAIHRIHDYINEHKKLEVGEYMLWFQRGSCYYSDVHLPLVDQR